MWLCATTGSDNAKSRSRYRGPRLVDLTLNDLRRREQPWQDFLQGGEVGAWRTAYNLPEHTAHLCERCEENLVFYLVCSCQQCRVLSHDEAVQTASLAPDHG